ncbi:TetR/AcrR family transcriptional regulator [Rhodococcoides yunnanense]|uniref:TetR/AcrR family transcriptional regulator n=1 Tax=Rhodococcoides yunnanense TaxID=278209 RepID=UPI000934B615|nr:TetR/AcrR family transcriptional regulator [Rhodococcus yunnanensis]
MAGPHSSGATIREQQRAFTRERILEGAIAVFAQKGYLATTIDDIVNAAGAGRATFYLHFPTKRDIVSTLTGRLLPEVQQMYGALDEVLVDGTRTAMRAWMATAIGWMERYRVILGAADAASNIESVSSYRDAMDLADYMPRYLAQYPERESHRAHVQVALLAVQFRATYAYLLPDAGDRTDATNDLIIDAMTEIWLVGLRRSGKAAQLRR